MIGLKINEAKAFFLDKALPAKMSAMKRRVTIRQAMLVRKIDQRSMRPGGKKRAVSAPNEAPRSHGKRLLRKNIFALHDPETKGAVVGPALLNGKNKRNKGKTVPETLEYGGAVETTEVLWKGQWVSYGDKSITPGAQRFLPRRPRTVMLEPRPSVNPALETAKPQFAAMYANQLK